MQTGTISTIPGVTAAELYQIGTDTLVDTADTVVPGSNDPTHYVITFGGTPPGDYRMVLKIGSMAVAIEPKVSVAANSWAVAVAGESTGGGARTVVVTVNLSASPLQGALVRLSKGAESYIGPTNASGQVVFNVNDGTWQVSITAANASFSGASLVVDENENPTYLMVATSSPIASDPGKRTVTYTCIGIDGLPLPGATVLSRCIKSPGSGIAIMGTSQSATSDSNGLAVFTNRIVGATYEFSMGTGKKVSAVIPAGDSPLALESLVGK